jgi:hypothetical protein
MPKMQSETTIYNTPVTRPLIILCLLSALALACVASASIPAKLAASTPTTTPMPTDSQQTQQATVTADALHLRAKPNYKAALVWYLKRGDIVTVTGPCMDGWVPVAFGDMSGFVNADFLDGELCPK